MIRFEKDGVGFGCRAAGVVLSGNRILLQTIEFDGDKPEIWSLPGGRIEMLETSEEALVREMQEELDTEVKIERLLWIVEEFWNNDMRDGRPEHGVGFYYLMTFPPESDVHRHEDVFEGHEENYRLYLKWHQLDVLDQIDVRPSFLKSAILSLPDTLLLTSYAGTPFSEDEGAS